MESGYITLLVMFAMNQAITLGIIIYLIWQRTTSAKKIAKLQVELFETYRKKAPSNVVRNFCPTARCSVFHLSYFDNVPMVSRMGVEQKTR